MRNNYLLTFSFHCDNVKLLHLCKWKCFILISSFRSGLFYCSICYCIYIFLSIYSIFILAQCCRSTEFLILQKHFYLIFLFWFETLVCFSNGDLPSPRTDMQIFVARLLLNEKNSFCPQFCMQSKTFWGQGGGCVLDQSLFWAQVLILRTYSDWVVVTNPWIICVFLVLSRAIWIAFSYFPYFC